VTETAPHVNSWYAQTANPAPDRPVLHGEIRCDVAVLGAGYAGLSAALALAERGFDVVVVEGRRVGWGASGRNGGQIVTGYNPSMGEIEGWVGPEDAKRLWELAEEAKRQLTDTVTRHAIQCNLTLGYLFAALKPRQMTALFRMAEEWQRYGYAGLRMVEQDEMRQRVGSRAYIGGLYDPHGGHLHPLNYALGLAQACEKARVRIFEGSLVTRIETGAAPLLQTKTGTVRPRFLVLAGNTLIGRLVPAMASRIASVGTYILATEPIARARMPSVLRDDVAVADLNFVLNYFRRSADYRLLFGARVSYSGRQPAALRARMRQTMLQVFPQLADIRITHCWGGHVDITMNRAPDLGRLGPVTYYAQGFSGQGVALTGIAGRVIAEAIAGQAERFDVFARIPHAGFPGGVLRRPALMLGMLWYRMRDML
jgi:gamma-glutamylputrescine oxidase